MCMVVHPVHSFAAPLFEHLLGEQAKARCSPVRSPQNETVKPIYYIFFGRCHTAQRALARP